MTLLLDHVSGRGRRPIQRPRIGASLPHFPDMALGGLADCASAALRRRPRLPASALRRAQRDEQIDLRTVEYPRCTRGTAARPAWTCWPVRLTNSSSMYPSDRIVTMVKRDSSCITVPTARTGRTITRASTVFSPHPAALHLVEAHLDGLAVVLFLALVDRDVVHPHPVLLRDRRGVGQAHGIAVVPNLAWPARCSGGFFPPGWNEISSSSNTGRYSRPWASFFGSADQ